ncbi:hypothetical protein GCM10010211_21650 [Streptomyces albospinus]|uniref:Uncharacterized protein n=1 Tax=Streptomyces albospinus TaxID=285515 RepID=A0ABQ2UXI6_9ACTN|nr:hypothetical protein GCM10010211_21650 [Streptomyces albospinus]
MLPDPRPPTPDPRPPTPDTCRTFRIPARRRSPRARFRTRADIPRRRARRVAFPNSPRRAAFGRRAGKTRRRSLPAAVIVPRVALFHGRIRRVRTALVRTASLSAGRVTVLRCAHTVANPEFRRQRVRREK